MSARHHITIDVCPVCSSEDKAVGDLDEHVWYCFNCKSKGTLTIDLAVTEGVDPAA